MKLLSRKKENISENSAETIKTKKKFTKKQLRVISIILVVVITIGCFFAYKVFFGKENSAKAAITAVASRGNVSSVIEGSGTLEALQQYEITSLIKGEVVADYFEEGDMVEKDDVLYQMDDEAGMESIDNARSSLKKATSYFSGSILARILSTTSCTSGFPAPLPRIRSLFFSGFLREKHSSPSEIVFSRKKKKKTAALSFTLSSKARTLPG